MSNEVMSVSPHEDAEQLRLLSIFHYIVAGAAMIFALMPLMHFIMGLAMLFGGFGNGEEPAMRAMGCFFVALSLLFITLGISFGVLLILAGRNLAERRNYRFCLVMACVACVFMPLGTVLGVFTILVLMRESVKAEFGVEPAG